MAIKFVCMKCDRKLTAPDDAEGKIAPCPQCGTKTRIPTAGIALAPEYQVVTDQRSNGGNRSNVSAGAANEPRRVGCPNCGELILPTAVLCRFCGESVDDSSPVLGKSEKKRMKRDLNSLMDDLGATWRWVSILVGIIAVGCFIFAMLSTGGTKAIEDDEISSSAMATALGILLLLSAAVGGVCSWGSYFHHRWAIYLGLILGYLIVLDCIWSIVTSGGHGIGIMIAKLALFGNVVYKSHQAAAISWRLPH